MSQRETPSGNRSPRRMAERPRTGDVLSADCPSREVLRNVTSRWGGLVLKVLNDGELHRFSDLRRTIGGVSEKMLAQTLRALELDGFVRRVSYPVVPPHVEYSLTPAGAEIARRVEELATWIEDHLPAVMKSRRAAQQAA